MRYKFTQPIFDSHNSHEQILHIGFSHYGMHNHDNCQECWIIVVASGQEISYRITGKFCRVQFSWMVDLQLLFRRCEHSCPLCTIRLIFFHGFNVCGQAIIHENCENWTPQNFLLYSKHQYCSIQYYLYMYTVEIQKGESTSNSLAPLPHPPFPFPEMDFI